MSRHIAIRDATPEDLPALFALRADARKQTYRAFLSEHSWRSFAIQNKVSAKNIKAWQEKARKYFLADRYVFRVAVSSNGTAGWLLAAKRGPELHVMRLFVDPAAQGRGIGGALLDDMLANYSHELATLTVLKPNEGAISFYKRHGFIEAGDANYSFLGVPCIKMEQRA